METYLDAIMDSHTGKLAFTIGIFIFIFALIPLPFLKPGSSEFVVDVIALILSLVFLALVIWDIRRQARIFNVKSNKKIKDQRIERMRKQIGDKKL